MTAPRDLWQPVFGEFGIRPWEMHLVTPEDVDAIREHLERLSK